MSENLKQDPAPYIEMRDAGATAEEVFVAAKNAGHKNFECIMLLCGVFGLELNEAREISHKIFAQGKIG